MIYDFGRPLGFTVAFNGHGPRVTVKGQGKVLNEAHVGARLKALFCILMQISGSNFTFPEADVHSLSSHEFPFIVVWIHIPRLGVNSITKQAGAIEEIRNWSEQ